MKLSKVAIGLFALTWLAAGWSGSAHESKANGGIPLSEISPAAYKLTMHSQDRLDLGDFWSANRAARKAVDLDPDAVFAWIQLANVAASFPEFTEALKKAESIKDRGTRGEQLWLELNQTFLANDAEQRLTLSEALVDMYPESPRAWLILAGVQTGSGRYDEARQSNDKAIHLDPKSAAAYTANGLSYIFNQPVDPDKAERYMARAAEIRSDDASAWINLGDAHRAQLNLEKARTDYSKAMMLDRDNEIAPIKRGHVNSFLGNYSEARSDYDKGVELGQASAVPNLANYRAFVSIYAGNAVEAITELDGVLGEIAVMDMATLYRDNEIAPIKRGHVNSFLGNYSEARSDYDKGVELGQASAVPNLANYRAFVSIYAGNAVEAITELDGVLGEIAVMDMAETEKNGSRIFTLQNMATIYRCWIVTMR